MRVALAAASMALVSCGGGERPDAAGDRESAAAAGGVVTAESARVLHGEFASFAGYLAHSRRALRAEGAASASFPVVVRRPGYYELAIWWPQALAGAGEVALRVRHAAGETVLAADPSASGGQWNVLGVFPFDAAHPGEVVLTSDGAAVLVVDALRFRFAGTERPALEFPAGTLAVGLKDEPYAAAVAARGGAAPYRYELRAGALPPGVVLDATSGRLSGIPARAGVYGFTLAAVDAAGSVASASLEIVVSDAADAESGATGAMPGGGGAARERAAATDDGLLAFLTAMPEGAWGRANLNHYADVWTPAELRPLMGSSNPTPAKIILAWSSFAWDPNRGNLLLYGGGHANYRGNDVYLWRGATRRWERAALPSEMVEDSLGNINAIDGADKAPASAHTYDNTIYFPAIDRLVVFGGAADKNGGHYLTQASPSTSRVTGAYLFDPARAHPDRVGGSTGSHVKRVAPYENVVGGNMWSNRESWLNAGAASTPPSESFVNGCTGYAREAGKDVAYVRTRNRLYRYSIADLANPGADSWQVVGRYYATGSGSKATCAYDETRKTFVATGTNSVPFVYWNLNTPGTKNNDVPFVPNDPTGEFASLLSSNSILLHNCAIDFDSQRLNYALWCGDGRLWRMEPPPSLSASGWTIRRESVASGAAPGGDVGTGIMGKWQYVETLDAFVGLIDAVQGQVWVYKPRGWKGATSVNEAPQVAITQPAQGAAFDAGEAVTIVADASDSDGSVARVEFFAGTDKIGERLAPPYAIVWQPTRSGSVALSAVATDDKGATGVSAPVSITIGGGTGPTTVVLQRGLGAGTADTYLSSYHKTLNFGSAVNVQDYGAYYASLLRFAVFQSEGGPVPDGATIGSATLSIYKYSSYDMVYALHRMRVGWSEASATWEQRAPSLPWSVPGANGAGADYAAQADATAAVGFNPGWLHFDVTAAIAEMGASAPVVNHGWRLLGVSGYVKALKRFYASEYADDPALQPKLVISYE